MSTDVFPTSSEISQKTLETKPKTAIKAAVQPLSPRLRLWQVLREEYLLFHPQPPPPGSKDKPLQLNLEPDFWRLKEEQIEYTQLALCICRQENEVAQSLFGILGKQTCDKLREFDGGQPLSFTLREAILEALNKLIENDDFQVLHSQTSQGKEILKNVRDESEPGVEYPELKLDSPLDKPQLVNRWLLEESLPEGIVSIDESLTAKYYQAIHKEGHAALCLSGGGIRSATFNLGILQGLARHGLLEEFDYLSTVSGGGYTGGWLSAWIHRQGLKQVVAQLSDPPTSPIEPEPKPLVHLRAFSNYLSPRLGLLSADTWTMVATLLRNIILNWLVFIPILIALLILPRMWLSFLYNYSLNNWALAFKSTFGFSLSLAIGSITQVIALTYIGLNLPSSGQNKDKRRRLLWSPLILPLIISAIALATFWARDRSGVEWWDVVRYAWALVIIPVIICFGYRLLKAEEKLETFLQILGAVALIAIAQFIIGSIAWWGGTNISFFISPRDQIILYSCLAVPTVLGLLLLSGTLISGLTSRYTEDDDQEWWARSGAWIYIVMLAWIVFFALVLYGPYLFVGLRYWWSEPGKLKLWFAPIGTVAGIISGAISLYGGFSAKTPANEQEAEKAGAGGIASQALTSLLGPVFLAFIFILLSFTAGWLLTLSGSLSDGLKSLLHVPAGLLPSEAIQHLEILKHSSWRLLGVLFLLLVLLGTLMSRAISTNKFSLHYFWRNRIIRAYLGASHDLRKPNPFTGFDTDDNVYMHELRPYQPGSPIPEKEKPPRQKGDKKLFHVLNVALNLAKSNKLAWQERKAESFTISPLHAGNYMLGYRKAMNYGRQLYNGKQGISLGTSVAISGAFASPNMGYMMSSPVVRFLMTLFNVRFGWWLGNPGRAGDNGLPFWRTYDRDSPRLSMIPIFQEALGLTDDEAGYVYLSDGGHFENFGLYEMVLRRCRLVVIGDASSDEDYTFQSLGLSIRQIRIDLGVPIKFDKFHITGRSKDGKGTYCAIGKILYSCVDGCSEEMDGTLILIKATLVGDEPRDVLNYASEHTTFPQEFIGDQWFSESQFESYRALGSHIVDALCKEPVLNAKIKDRNILTLTEFKDRVERI
jgi:hypothetical protein